MKTEPRRPPLPPSCGGRPCARSFSRLTPQTPSLGPFEVRAITCCPAFLLTSPKFDPQWPRRHGVAAAAAARGGPPRPILRHQSISGKLNHTPGPFVPHLRPSLAAGEPAAAVTKGIYVKFLCAGTCLLEGRVFP
jgi:hypothetical protein